MKESINTLQKSSTAYENILIFFGRFVFLDGFVEILRSYAGVYFPAEKYHFWMKKVSTSCKTVAQHIKQYQNIVKQLSWEGGNFLFRRREFKNHASLYSKATSRDDTVEQKYKCSNNMHFTRKTQYSELIKHTLLSDKTNTLNIPASNIDLTISCPNVVQCNRFHYY